VGNKLLGIALLLMFMTACGSWALVKPTALPTSMPTDRPACTPWSKLARHDEGKELCVTGEVLFGVSSEDTTGDIQYWVTRFSTEPGFYLINDTLPEIQPGDCITVFGRVQLDDSGLLFIENGEVNQC
jgi:hypothetical protein